jgi:uncharacterized protein
MLLVIDVVLYLLIFQSRYFPIFMRTPSRLACIAVFLVSMMAGCASVSPLSPVPPSAARPPAQPVPAIVAQTVPQPAPAQKAPAESDSPANTPVEKIVPHIALIVPLTSKTFGKVADAVKQGFIAGATADGKAATPYRIYAADDEAATLALLYRKAAVEGAIAIVGGVTRDGANTLARESGSIPSLALNAPEGGMPESFFYMSLNLDWEARLVARAASQDGLKRVAMVTSATALAKRIQDSFEKEWQRLGGEVVAKVSFNNDANDGQRIKSPLDRAQPDIVFIAGDPRAARFARPYLPTGVPVFATSHALDARAGNVANIDLEGVRFLEMPWFVEKDHPAVMAYSRPVESMPIDYERLYALGIDAWRLTQVILKSANSPSAMRNISPLDGVTGRLTLDGGQFVRALSTVEIRDGQIVLYRSAE